jgi:hypothetical protein
MSPSSALALAPPPASYSPPKRLVSANPADDLAEIRAELARLKSREQALVELLLARPELRQAGHDYHVELDFVQDPVLNIAALPPALRESPLLWRHTLHPVLTCRAIAQENARPGWPIQREGH